MSSADDSMAGRLAGRSTQKQREVLAAYLRYGSYSQAAKRLRLNENTARGRVAQLMKLHQCESVAQLAYRLAVEGWRLHQTE